MNRERWTNPGIPISILALKLCEEAAEVGGEISDAHTKESFSKPDYYGRALEEIEHVEFLCRVLRERLEDSLRTKFPLDSEEIVV